MATAIQTFGPVEYFGDLVTIEEGTWCIDDHELVRRFPQMFKGIAPRKPRGVGRKGASRVRGSSAARPTGYTNKVVFTGYAWGDLLRHVENGADGFETGGHLGGYSDRGVIVVTDVWDRGLYTERGPNVIYLDRDRHLEYARRAGVEAIGDFHTHDELSVRPSPQDERAWIASVRASVGAYAGVIVTPRDVENHRWANANVHAWLARRDGIKLATITRG